MTTAVQMLTHAGDTEPAETFFRMSVARYHQMIAAGIFTPEDKIELLEGWIVNKMPKSRLHSLVTALLRQALERIISAAYYVDSQEPVTMSDSEPEPDVFVVRGQMRDFTEHPGPQDLALLVEVADSSLQRDQTWKKQLYARHHIPVYWIVNLPDQQIEVYSNPTGPARNPNYLQLRTYHLSDSVPVVIDNQEIGQIAVQSLFP